MIGHGAVSFAACTCTLGLSSLPESASRFEQAACRFWQVFVKLLKLKRRVSEKAKMVTVGKPSCKHS